MRRAAPTNHKYPTQSLAQEPTTPRRPNTAANDADGVPPSGASIGYGSYGHGNRMGQSTDRPGVQFHRPARTASPPTIPLRITGGPSESPTSTAAAAIVHVPSRLTSTKMRRSGKREGFESNKSSRVITGPTRGSGPEVIDGQTLSLHFNIHVHHVVFRFNEGHKCQELVLNNNQIIGLIPDKV